MTLEKGDTTAPYLRRMNTILLSELFINLFLKLNYCLVCIVVFYCLTALGPYKFLCKKLLTTVISHIKISTLALI